MARAIWPEGPGIGEQVVPSGEGLTDNIGVSIAAACLLTALAPSAPVLAVLVEQRAARDTWLRVAGGPRQQNT